MKVLFDARALEDVEAMGGWWRANRPAAPDLFEQELAVALDQIRRLPASVPVYRVGKSGQLIRRVGMHKTKNHIYFVHDATAQVVRVVALWGAVRGHGPPLG